MIQSKLKSAILVLLAAAVAGLPLTSPAQADDKAASSKKEVKPKKPTVTPFNGKLKEVDRTAKTISVGKLTIQVTSETIISKADKPAMFEDGVVGEVVSGAYRKTEDGKLHATKINFGPKPKKTEPTKEKKAKENPETT